MLQRVKDWLEQGIEVRIVTARVWESEYYTEQNYKEAQQARKLVQEWCIKHIGKMLPVIYYKDNLMKELWDDRAVQVVKNTGERVGNHFREGK